MDPLGLFEIRSSYMRGVSEIHTHTHTHTHIYSSVYKSHLLILAIEDDHLCSGLEKDTNIYIGLIYI